MTYVAFLRAVNVGGRGIVTKDALRGAFTRAGGTAVRTFIQSGNVLFDATPDTVDTIVAGAQRRLRLVLGSEPVVMVRRASDIARLVREGPFARVSAPPEIKRYVIFLLKRPVRRPLVPFVSAAERLEAVSVRGRECWLLSGRKPSGMYGFPGPFVEKALGVPATARNWSTVTRLAAVLAPPR
jgi:uncharacterized protein (DUF1697 family)